MPYLEGTLCVSKLGTQIPRFNHIPELYAQEYEFSSIFYSCQYKPQGGFYVFEGFLFN